MASEVPEELIELAQRGLERRTTRIADFRVYDLLYAVLPKVRADERAKVAEEIEAARQKVSDQEGVTVEDAVRIGSICNGLSRAAKIARGAQ